MKRVVTPEIPSSTIDQPEFKSSDTKRKIKIPTNAYPETNPNVLEGDTPIKERSPNVPTKKRTNKSKVTDNYTTVTKATPSKKINPNEENIWEVPFDSDQEYE